MCGRCAILTSKPCLYSIAGVDKFRRNGDRVVDRYNFGPYDSKNCVPVVHVNVDIVDNTESNTDSNFNTNESVNNSVSNTHCQSQSLALTGMRWGLIPSFAKDEKQTLNTFNSRSDKLTGSGMWNRLILKPKTRCIVVMQGFYEWGAIKRPRFIQLAKDFKGFSLQQQQGESYDYHSLTSDNDSVLDVSESNNNRSFPMLMAGLYDRYTGFGHSQALPLESCSIVTIDTPAPTSTMNVNSNLNQSNLSLQPPVPSCALMHSIHDRLPLMLLDKQSALRWLNEECSDSIAFDRMLREIERNMRNTMNKYGEQSLKKQAGGPGGSSSSSFFHIYEVDKKLVSNSRNESPDCILDSKEYARKMLAKNFGISTMLAPKAKKGQNLNSSNSKSQQGLNQIQNSNQVTQSQSQTVTAPSSTSASVATVHLNPIGPGSESEKRRAADDSHIDSDLSGVKRQKVEVKSEDKEIIEISDSDE